MRITLEKILLISPIIILVAMLYFADYTVIYFQDVTYSFVFNSNIESVRMLEAELDELDTQGYPKTTYSDLHNNIIHIFNKTLGGKHAVITFLMDEDGTVHHSNSENQQYVTPFIENESALLQQAAKSSSGQFNFISSGKEQAVYYHTFFDGSGYYRLFITIDHDALDNILDANKIVIPISVVALLLLVSVEDSIWLRVVRKKKVILFYKNAKTLGKEQNNHEI